MAVRLSALRAAKSPFTLREIPGIYLCLRLSPFQDLEGLGNLKISSDLIRNQIHKLRDCNTEPQQITLLRESNIHSDLYYWVY
jgi:hypothetical protein